MATAAMRSPERVMAAIRRQPVDRVPVVEFLIDPRVGDRMALIGNIDGGHLLAFGTAEDVREAVRQAIADAAPGGGYLLSSSNSIHSNCLACRW